MDAIREDFDLLIVGGGINGAGIARDAAGRGLKVLLVEKDDLSSATSSGSSKLIHGGLRYLEQYEFRLVREALAEREVMLRLAPHIIRPCNFVLPYDASMRPAWMIRAGLWLYDHLGGRETLPGSMRVNFPHLEFSAGLRPDIRFGFVYSDCRVDDARLTVINAVSAREKGASVLTRTKFVSGHRVAGQWEAVLEDAGTHARRTVRAKALVNASGPWVAEVLGAIEGKRTQASARLVKGSHIVVPKIHSLGHAYLLQNADKRVCFVIPFESRFSLIGTTDVPIDSPDAGWSITPQEVDYLVAAVNRYLAKPISAADVVSSFSAIRPLFDDGSANPSQVTRDYVLKTDDEEGKAPLLSVFGGKITTYRCLAEVAVERFRPYFPELKGSWTGQEPLPGGNVRHFNSFRDEMRAHYGGLGREFVEGVVRRHGSRTPELLGAAGKLADLGRHFGAGLTETEIEHLRKEEWARTAHDVLWRRTKCGLHMDTAQRAAVAQYFGEPPEA